MNYSESASRLPKELLRQFPSEIEALTRSLPFLDVRSPFEYSKGQAPNSTNLPILEDSEREQVGIAYKTHGADSAVELGHNLVSGKTKEKRMKSWGLFLKTNPECRLICWRGGQRSRITQEWLRETGIEVIRLEGGFKALRQCLIYVMESMAGDSRSIWILGGRTGSKKTVVIRELANSIDLENLAEHRGSAFGSFLHKQPPPVTFENALATKLLQHQLNHLVLEDESRTIGRLAIPEPLYSRMKNSPIAMIEANLETRVEHIFQEYVEDPLSSGLSENKLSGHYQEALNRIHRRLGREKHTSITKKIRGAFDGKSSHQGWIKALLVDYYDPMYDYQIQKKQERINFIGSQQEVTQFLKTKT